jgi:hypothetical protein
MKLDLTLTPVTEALPDPGRTVLLQYRKGGRNNVSGNGRVGTFITQGKMERRAGFTTWYDYTDRQLQRIGAPTSKNHVIAWAYLD